MLAEVVFWQVDIDEPELKAVAKEFGVYALPTYVVANPQGEVLAAFLGFEEADAWAAAVRREAADPRTFQQKQDAFALAPAVPLGRTVAQTAQARGDFVEAVRVYRELERLEPGTSDHALPILDAMSSGYRNQAFTLDEVTAAAGRAAEAAAGDPEKLVEVAMTMQYVAQQAEDVQVAIPFLRQAVEATEGATDEDLLKARARMLPAYALYIEGDVEKAVRLRHELLPENWQDDPRALNGLANWHLQHRVDLEAAEKWARRGVEVAGSDKERANILDTLAEILAATGRPAGALEAIDRAVELDPENEFFKKQQQRFADQAAGGTEAAD